MKSWPKEIQNRLYIRIECPLKIFVFLLFFYKGRSRSICSRPTGMVLGSKEDGPSAVLARLAQLCKTTDQGILCQGVDAYERFLIHLIEQQHKLQNERNRRSQGHHTKDFLAITTNTILLRLSDIFSSHSTTNSVRSRIVMSFRRCRSCIRADGLLSADLFISQILGVLNNPDPVARSLVLHALGAMPLLIADRPDVHHRVFGCLETVNKLEYQAAMQTLEIVCAASPSFAKRILPEVEKKLESILVSNCDKVKWVRILQYMRKDEETILRTLNLCKGLLEKYGIVAITLQVIDVVTSLALDTEIACNDSVRTLTSIVKHDPRRIVQMHALKSLTRLVNSKPYDELVPPNILVDILSSTPEPMVQILVLNLMVWDCRQPKATLTGMQGWSWAHYRVLEQLLSHTDIRLAALSLHVILHLVSTKSPLITEASIAGVFT